MYPITIFTFVLWYKYVKISYINNKIKFKNGKNRVQPREPVAYLGFCCSGYKFVCLLPQLIFDSDNFFTHKKLKNFCTILFSPNSTEVVYLA